MRDDFAVFITTHERADNQITLNTLLNLGYTGKWYLVIDDTDRQAELYYEKYGSERVLMFDKAAFIGVTESCCRYPHPKAVVFARNAVESIAVELGYKYFMVVDDDITKLRFRYAVDESLKSAKLTNCIDAVFSSIINYVETSGVACLTFGFTNTYRGGVVAVEKFTSRNRLCAELFIRNASVPIRWKANFVEDLVTSIDSGLNGKVFLQFVPIQLELCMNEGTLSGGMCDAYNDTDKFKFYGMPVMLYPSCVSIKFDGHKWGTYTKSEFCIPKIISSRYRR